MPSHLTRLVFRSLTTNEPLFYRGCYYRAPRLRPCSQHGARLAPHAQQQRTFLDMLKPRRKLKTAKMLPGLETLAVTSHAMQRAVRPPPPKQVAEALKAFFGQADSGFDDLHLSHACAAFEYLLQNPKEDGGPWIGLSSLRDEVFCVLLNSTRFGPPKPPGPAHLQLGRALLAEMDRLLRIEPNPDAGLNLLVDEIQLLSRFGAATEAEALAAKQFENADRDDRVRHLTVCRVWSSVLRGHIEEKNAEGVVRVADQIRVQSMAIMSFTRPWVVKFFVEAKDLERAIFWYSYPTADAKEKSEKLPSNISASVALLKACAVHDRQSGQQIVTSMIEKGIDNAESWDVAFLWAAIIGKGPDEVDRMMSVLVRRNEEAHRQDSHVGIIRPDEDTINALVELCISRNDSYSAERYIAIGEKRGISPNERTFAMQIEYRISVGDLDGAKSAYFNLQGSSSRSKYSITVINQLIRALCVSNRHCFDEVMAMVDDLHERKAHFDPRTIAALTLLHLRRGEIPDAMDLLQLHAHQYSPTEREIIREALSAFILNSETSTADAWDGYQIMRNVFPETSKTHRVAVMDEFFARKRSDMACHVFFHMRNHVSENLRADRDVYIVAFRGYARCADAESLELTHNQLRLDSGLLADTQLRNAIMLAYASTEQNRKALGVWRDICESKEGPTYNSIAIAFRACEGMHWGGEHAKAIWRRLKEQDVEIDKGIWTAYMCAIARNHYHEEALALIESVEEEYGYTHDLHILGSWLNTTINSEKQKHVEAWIKERYPELWKEIEALGHWVTMDGFGYRQYNINRDLEP